MRKIKYLEEETNRQLYEAFKSGTSAKVAEKMYSILSRRVGKNFIFSSYPAEFSNKEGKFLGYFATLGSNTLVRINFLSGKNEQVHSIDIFYGSDSRTPDLTVNLMGYNIVQVIDQIEEVFTGQFRKWEESVKIREAVSMRDAIKNWVESHSNRNIYKDLKSGRVSMDDAFIEFKNYCVSVGSKAPPSVGAFRGKLSWYGRTYLQGDSVPSVTVSQGQTETPINTDSQAEAAYNDLFENEHIIKFRVLEFYCKEVARGNKNFLGLYVYGDGGVGKSHLAKVYLEPLPNCEYFTGKVKGYSGLTSLLFKHKDNKILVMDDSITKNDMSNTAIENILKAVLDPEPPRRVQLAFAESGESYYKDGVFYLTEEEMAEHKRLVSLNEVTEVIDMTDSDGMDVATDFTFNSVIVFLTNYPKVPQALQDRCWTLEMIFSNAQIIDIIKKNIAKIIPDNVPDATELFREVAEEELTEKDKKAVIEFMETQNASGLVKRKISIRVYKRLLSFYLATKHTSMWKKFLMMETSAASF